MSQLLPFLSSVPVAQGQSLFNADDIVGAAYFPEDCLLSMVAQLRDGTQAEVGMVGTEGVAGAFLIAGTGIAPAACVVQLPGVVLRIAAAPLQQAMEAHPALRGAMSRQAEALAAQAVGAVLCNARHTLEQRAARWLLMALDRVGGEEVAVTQEFLASMLAAHRPNVTAAMGVLRRAGVLEHRQGRVVVLDRTGLEKCACECYATVRQRTGSMLNQP